MQESRGNGAKQASYKKYIFLVVRIIVAFGALGLVLWQVEWDQLKGIFSQMNWWFFAFSLGIYMIGQMLVALRWLILVRAQGIALKTFPAIKLHFLGLFYNNAMPSSVGGDFLRAWYVSKYTDKREEAAVSVFVDRVMGLFGIFLIALFSYLFFGQGIKFDSTSPQEIASGSGATGLIWIVVILIGLAALLLLGMLKPSFRGLAQRLLHWIGRKLLVLLHKSGVVLMVYWRRPLVLLVTLLLTLGLQSLTIWAFWVLGRSMGIEASVRYYFVIFPGMWVVGALPITIAGVGVLEGGIAFLFYQLAQVPLALGTGLSLCQRMIWLLASIPGAFIHLMGGHLPASLSIEEGIDNV